MEVLASMNNIWMEACFLQTLVVSLKTGIVLIYPMFCPPIVTRITTISMWLIIADTKQQQTTHCYFFEARFKNVLRD